MNDIHISIISPMHNESKCVDEFMTRVINVMEGLLTPYEVIIINDGSTDDTEVKLRHFSKSNPNVKIISLARNAGQWAATHAGIQHSRGKYIVVMDSDLQHLPEEIPLLTNKIKKGYELVSGKRVKRKESLFLRRIPSLIANYLLRTITQCPVKDMGGYKCLDGAMARQLHIRAGQHRFLPALVWLRGGRVTEVDISSPPRFAGESHYGISRTFDVLFDIILFWLQYSFKSRPIYLFGRISLLMFFTSALGFFWTLYQKLFFAIDMGTRPLFLISLVGGLSSLIFLAFGFVLELLSNVHIAVTDSKSYIVQKIE
jgi:glycosyltransferase involved in cell wall biosynthesis